jgi:hypothetical protein
MQDFFETHTTVFGSLTERLPAVTETLVISLDAFRAWSRSCEFESPTFAALDEAFASMCARVVDRAMSHSAVLVALDDRAELDAVSWARVCSRLSIFLPDAARETTLSTIARVVGSLDAACVLCALAPLCAGGSDAKARALFARFDRRHTGQLQIVDFTQLVQIALSQSRQLVEVMLSPDQL